MQEKDDELYVMMKEIALFIMSIINKRELLNVCYGYIESF